MASARNGHPEVSAAAEHALIHDHRLASEKATPIDHAKEHPATSSERSVMDSFS